MGQKKRKLRATHLPGNEHAIRQFEKKIYDFDTSQVEQKLHSLPKEKKARGYRCYTLKLQH